MSMENQLIKIDLFNHLGIIITVQLIISSYFLAVHNTDIDKSVLINGFYPRSDAREKLEILIFSVAMYNVLFFLLLYLNYLFLYLYEYEFFLFIFLFVSLAFLTFNILRSHYY